jgi:hypothetical protein
MNMLIGIAARQLHITVPFENTHFEKMLAKVHRVKGGLMPVWKSRHISVEVKRIILLTCIRPIVEYGSEVWFPSDGQLQGSYSRLTKCNGTTNRQCY